VIELSNIVKRLGDGFALEIPALVVEPRRTLALVGPSGCGKSTLLRILVGLVRPDAGAVRIGGTEPAAASLRGVRRSIGYAIQEGGLFPHLTAGANLTLPARVAGWAPDRTAARVAALAELLHLEAALLGRYPAELSGGQRQRVSIMRALMLDPPVLLMDEPFGALDPFVRARLQREFAGIFRGLGKTVVLVTHDLIEASLLCDELALMRAGRILQRGLLRDLLEHPVDPFVSEFVRSQQPPRELWS
jgi:osmoprotectant transport system ATP-binding protein